MQLLEDLLVGDALKTYKRLEGDVRIMDYACAENNRNPVDPATGRTLTLDADGKPIDAGYREGQ